MKVAGIDFSINSPAVVVAELDSNYNVLSYDYIGFSSVLKTLKSDDKIVRLKKDEFNNDYDRYIFVRDTIIKFLYKDSHLDYMAIESYSLGSNAGLVFNIAECTMLTKSSIYEKGTSIKTYTPTQIKRLSTGKGNAKKDAMNDSFNELDTPFHSMIEHLTENKNPKEDLVDAFFILRMLITELKLRNGVIKERDLTDIAHDVFYTRKKKIKKRGGKKVSVEMPSLMDIDFVRKN